MVEFTDMKGQELLDIKETEDKIVQSIVNDGKQLDFNTISQMINKK